MAVALVPRRVPMVLDGPAASAAVYRAAVLAICLLVASVEPDGARSLPWLAVGVVVAVAATVAARVTETSLIIAGEAVAVGLCVPLTGGVQSPLLPYLLAPLIHAGLALGARRLCGVAGLALGALALAGWVAGTGATWTVYGTEAVRWVALGTSAGLVVDWSRRLEHPDATYQQALTLLTQLRDLTHRLPGSLDAWAVGGSVLDSCLRGLPGTRGAVLVPAGESVAPIAVRGLERLPWRHPMSGGGPLQQAWRSGEVVLDVRRADRVGRRGASTLLVLPVLPAVAGDRTAALVVLQRDDADAFPPAVVRRLQEIVSEHALRLQAALLFEDLRLLASVEEREVLAREMHNGVAQDLAAVGFALDNARRTAAGEPLAAQLGELRQQVRTMVCDIRLSITQLRGSVSASRGLGPVLGQYVRSAVTGTGMTAHLSLVESGFRLPIESEVELLRMAQAVVRDARDARAANLWVRLASEAPAAVLVVEHDGERPAVDVDGLRERAARVGGVLRVETRSSGGIGVTITMKGGQP